MYSSETLGWCQDNCLHTFKISPFLNKKSPPKVDVVEDAAKIRESQLAYEKKKKERDEKERLIREEEEKQKKLRAIEMEKKRKQEIKEARAEKEKELRLGKLFVYNIVLIHVMT